MSSLIVAVAMVISALVGDISPERSEQIAEYYVETSGLTRVDLPLLIALSYHESAFRTHARSSVGAAGVMQLYGHYHVQWLRECRDAERVGIGGDATCEALNVRWGGWAMRDHQQRCGGAWLRGLSSYRGSGCNPTGKALYKARATLQLARMVRWRLAHPSTKPLVAPLLTVSGGG